MTSQGPVQVCTSVKDNVSNSDKNSARAVWDLYTKPEHKLAHTGSASAKGCTVL